jgi:hypothetical protein
MADIVPNAASDASHTGSTRDSLWQDPGDTSSSLLTDISEADALLRRHQKYLYRASFFNNPAQPLAWRGQVGIVAAAWQGNTLSDTAAVSLTGGSVVYESDAGGAADGWIHVIYGSGTLRGSNSLTPVAKGTTGYTPLGWVRGNHRSATPNTLTSGKLVSTAGLRFQVYPFTLSGGGSDRWQSQSELLCPNILCVAWQADAPATNSHKVVTTLDAAGDVVFTQSSAGAITGWLWTWRRS